MTDDPKRYESTGFGILNPQGGLWTDNFFEQPEKAAQHLREFWSRRPMEELDEFRIVMVESVVTVVDGSPMTKPSAFLTK